MILTGDAVHGPLREEVEVCVVGSGAGGAVVAAELAERGREVLVLEEGGHHPTEGFSARPLEMMGRLYRDRGMTCTLGTPGIPVPLGRCVGGTTTVNSGTCFRVPPRVLSKWSKDHGLADLDEAALAPLYERVEARIEVRSAPVATLSANASFVARGAEALGWRHRPLLRNIHECRGTGVCAFGCPRGAKQSMLVSYIPRALAHGARLHANCRVERLRVEAGRALGVEGTVLDPETDRPRFPFSVRARALVLSAGTVHSPVLLARSGLAGGSRELGRNLRIHPALKVSALVAERVTAWAGVPQGYCVEEFADEGILMEEAFTPPEVGCIALPYLGHRHRALMERYDHVVNFAALVSDSSTGRVWPTPGGRGVMTYRLNRADHEALVRTLRLLARLCFAGGAERVFLPMLGMPELASPDDLSRLEAARPRPGDLELAAFHPMGTCRMGADPRRSVVDPRLRVHGVRGLWVVDASVFPSSLSVNPQLTIMAMATRASGDIHEALGG